METSQVFARQVGRSAFNRIYEEWKQNNSQGAPRFIISSIESMRNGNMYLISSAFPWEGVQSNLWGMETQNADDRSFCQLPFNRIYEEWKLFSPDIVDAFLNKFNRIYEEWKPNPTQPTQPTQPSSIESMRNGNHPHHLTHTTTTTQFNRIYEEWKHWKGNGNGCESLLFNRIYEEWKLDHAMDALRYAV